MSLGTLPWAYLGWHYTLALRDLANLIKNLLAFVARFFSLRTLVKTFFAPWRRLGEAYVKGFHPEAWLETLILNLVMRLVGIILRLGLLIIGSLILALAIILAVILVIFWLALPLFIPILILSGLNLILWP